jgi:hypothetical protein
VKQLKMPIKLTAQNGKIVKETVKVGVSGCPKHKAAKKHKATKAKSKARH